MLGKLVTSGGDTFGDFPLLPMTMHTDNAWEGTVAMGNVEIGSGT